MWLKKYKKNSKLYQAKGKSWKMRAAAAVSDLIWDFYKKAIWWRKLKK